MTLTFWCDGLTIKECMNMYKNHIITLQELKDAYALLEGIL